jgi:hypothetical protein
MAKKKNLFEFLGESLNDSDLKKYGENMKFGFIESNSAPKRNNVPLTYLSTKNTLNDILEFEKRNKKKRNKK